MTQNNGLHETVVQKLSEDSTSTFAKYQNLYVGSKSLSSFLKYEFLTFLLSPIPGALGFFLRKIFYKNLFAAVGKGLVVSPNITLRCPNHTHIGDNVVLDGNVVIDARGEKSKIEIGDMAFIGKNTICSCVNAEIKMGHDVSIGPGSYIRASHASIILGSYLTIGAHTIIISGNPDYKRLDIPMMMQTGSVKGITIGDDVWFGVGVRVIDGVKIGSGCVIGAGAVVTKNIPDLSIAAGVPAKVIGSRKKS